MVTPWTSPRPSSRRRSTAWSSKATAGSSSGTLVVGGEERPLRQWDFFHCPAGVAHVIVGGPIVVAAFGARQDDRTEYVADPAAAKSGAAPARTTTDSREAYEGWERPTHTRYDGWLD